MSIPHWGICVKAFHTSLSQIDNLENGTEYYVRVAAYNGDGNDATFTTYGAPADASPFPVMTMEQVIHTSRSCSMV